MVKVVGNLRFLIQCPRLVFDSNALHGLSMTTDVNQEVETPLRALNAMCGHFPADGHGISRVIGCLTANEMEELTQKSITLAMGAIRV